MIPITRKEHYLNRIVGNKDYPIPEEPITTEEFFFAEILGEAVQAPEPLTRYQMYLAKIAGRNIEIPYPEVRLEYFLARAAGMDVETPVPITREEIYWSNYTAIVEFELENVPPLTYKAIEGTLKNYRIYGNTVDGESVGDRTANLFNGELQNGYWSTLETLAQTSSAVFRSFKIFLPAGTYTITFATNVNIVRLIADGAITQNIGNNLTEYTFTTQTNDDVGFSFRITGTSQVPWDNSDIMLNIGSVAIPYEPYGYRVPVAIEGKNLLQNTVKSQAKNGVTFTVNNDGSVTCNGTASNNTFLKIGDLSLTSQSYILTGCPSDGGKDSYVLRCYENGNIKGTDFGNGVNINESIDGYIEIRITSGYTCDNLTFYPMVCKADIQDDTYEPYHAPTTTNLYLPEQIKMVGNEVEYMDFKEQKLYLSDGTSVDVTLPALPTISGTNILSVNTEVQPSKVYIKGEKER